MTFQSVCVCDVQTDLGEVEPTSAVSTELPRLQWVPPQEVPLWDIGNCSLLDGQILISQEDEVPAHAHKRAPTAPNHQSCLIFGCVCVCPSQPTTWIRNRVSSCLSNPSMQNLVDIDTGQYTHTHTHTHINQSEKQIYGFF